MISLLKHCNNSYSLLTKSRGEVGSSDTAWDKQVGKWRYQLCICHVDDAFREFSPKGRICWKSWAYSLCLPWQQDKVSPSSPTPSFSLPGGVMLWLVLAGARPYKERAAGPPTEKWSPSFQLHLHEHLHPGLQTGYSPAWHHGALSRRGPAFSFAVCSNQRSLVIHDVLP